VEKSEEKKVESPAPFSFTPSAAPAFSFGAPSTVAVEEKKPEEKKEEKKAEESQEPAPFSFTPALSFGAPSTVASIFSFGDPEEKKPEEKKPELKSEVKKPEEATPEKKETKSEEKQIEEALAKPTSSLSSAPVFSFGAPATEEKKPEDKKPEEQKIELVTPTTPAVFNLAPAFSFGAEEQKSKPTEIPAETKPEEEKPVVTKPVETKPEERPQETKPEPKPEEQKPAEPKSEEKKPEPKAEEKTEVKKPEQTQPEEEGNIHILIFFLCKVPLKEEKKDSLTFDFGSSFSFGLPPSSPTRDSSKPVFGSFGSSTNKGNNCLCVTHNVDETPAPFSFSSPLAFKFGGSTVTSETKKPSKMPILTFFLYFRS
jgi:hypothetical protein